MTKGQIIDQLCSKGYIVEYDTREIIVKIDSNHSKSFSNWEDVELYYELKTRDYTRDNRLMEYSKDILCAMLKRYGEDAGAVDIAISYAKELIEKTKQND